MDHTLTNCTFLSNDCGLYVVKDTVVGGGNLNAFNECRFQSNAVGAFINGKTGVANLNFNGGFFQANTVCGLAAFDAAEVICSGVWFEGNGTGAATDTIDGETINRSNIMLDNGHIILDNCRLGAVGAAPAEDESFIYYINNSKVTFKDTSSENTSDTHLARKGDNTDSHCNFLGHCVVTGVVEGCYDYSGCSVSDTYGQAMIIGAPLLKRTNDYVNNWGVAPYIPDYPEFAGGSGVIKNFAQFDESFGKCYAMKWPTTASLNRNAFGAYATAITTDDYIVLSFYLHCDTEGAFFNIFPAGTGNFFFGTGKRKVRLSNKWQRVVVFGKSNGASNRFDMFLESAGTEGAELRASNFMVLFSASGAKNQEVNQVVREGLFNSFRGKVHYTGFSSDTITTIPSGKHNTGDRIIPLVHNGGQPMGWICTTAGYGRKQAWTTGNAYVYGDYVSNGGNIYKCVTLAGGNAGATAPVHTSGTVSDDTLDWLFIATSAVAVYTAMANV